MPLRVRFVTAANIQRPLPGTRNVIVRRVERHAGVTMVDVDGAVFAVESCGSRRRPLACLTLRSDLSFDEPEPEPDPTNGGGFSQPPP